MKRKIYDQLLLWKERRKGKSAMMIEGARRVGKSYIVKEFAQREYKSYILIDFFKVGDDVKDLVRNYKDNLDMLFTYLSTYFSTKRYPRESIIVFDEIEFCPAARAAVKYLVEDGRYDYMETGSLLGMKMSTKKMVPTSMSEPNHPRSRIAAASSHTRQRKALTVVILPISRGGVMSRRVCRQSPVSIRWSR